MVFFHQYPIQVVVSLHFPNIPHFSSSSFFQSTWKSSGKDSRGTYTWLASTRQFATSFFIFHSPINADSVPILAETGWNPPKHMLKNKNKKQTWVDFLFSY